MFYNKKIILTLVFLATLFIFFGILFFIKNKNEENLQNLSVTEEFIYELKKSNKHLEIQKNKLGFRWNDGSGYTIFVSADESVTIIMEGLDPVERDIVVKEYFDKEISLIDNILMNRHFVFNQENSASDILDDRFYDYIQSYEKDGEKCSVVVNPDFSSHPGFSDMGYSMTVSCGSGFEKAKLEQMPFLEALNLKDKNSVVLLKTQKDHFYEIGIGTVRGGSTAILKKENENYRVLYIGQESPSCELINKESIPKEVLSSIGEGGCFEKDGNYIN